MRSWPVHEKMKGFGFSLEAVTLKNCFPTFLVMLEGVSGENLPMLLALVNSLKMVFSEHSISIYPVK